VQSGPQTTQYFQANLKCKQIQTVQET